MDNPVECKLGLKLYRHTENRIQQQEYDQNADNDDRRPGNDVEDNPIDMPSHQAAIIDQQNDEYQQNGQHSRIQVLQDDQHLDDGKSWNKRDEHAQDNQAGENTLEDWSFTETA